ncbi:hypothetical protein EV360DRAFT_31464, partial [Lentinula raphanica]
ERNSYYRGISPDPPVLLYRSDIPSNPFVKRVGENFWQQLPYKTIHGVFGAPLNAIWDTVARKIRLTTVNAARFVTHFEDETTSCGPVVIWTTVHPNSTSAKEAHDASLDILALLEDKEVHGVVIEWTEGVVERL